jgi:hypothetical protein
LNEYKAIRVEGQHGIPESGKMRWEVRGDGVTPHISRQNVKYKEHYAYIM